MEFQFIQRDVPKSAWLARMNKNRATVDVQHGTSVEVYADFFIEGAWDGDFAAGHFEQAVTLLGSGGKSIDEQTVVFSAPTHIFERLYTIRLNDALLVSNSLVFLLAESEQSLDPQYTKYPQTLYRNFGINEAGRSLPTQSQSEIRLHYSTNVVVNSRLELREAAKTAPNEFTNFGRYRRFLESSLVNVFNNANDTNRNVLYSKPVVLLSTGYDSTATAVLSKEIGCNEAITFREARPLDIDHYCAGDDNGKRIANALGMDCLEIERLDYLNSQRRFPEAEIFVTAHFVDLYALSLEDYLSQDNILLTGFRGDIMWNKHLDENQDAGGPGIAEFRLRKGFLHVPLPYLGTQDCRPTHCKVTRSVREIANSSEMAPWSVGGEYDRPIPRRIVEEAGIDRNSFAKSKKAVAVWFGREAPQKIMTETSYRDYEVYRQQVCGPEVNQGILWAIERMLDCYRG